MIITQHGICKGKDKAIVDFLAKIVEVGGTVDATTTDGASYLVTQLKSNNLWDKILWLTPHLGGTVASAAINLMDTTKSLGIHVSSVIESGGLRITDSSYDNTWAKGHTTDVTFGATDAPTVITKGNYSYGAYISSNYTAAATSYLHYICGVTSGGNYMALYLNSPSSQTYVNLIGNTNTISNGTVSQLTAAVTGADRRLANGFVMTNYHTAAATGPVRFSKYRTSLNTGASPVIGNTFTSSALKFGACVAKTSNSNDRYLLNTVGVYFIGRGLTSAEAAILETILSTFNTTIMGR